MLTRQQHQLLTFIARFTTENGWAPSYDEMRAGMGLASKSGINRLMAALVERGFITKRRDRARAIEVIRMPGDVGPDRLKNAAPELLDCVRNMLAASSYEETMATNEAARALVARLESAR